MEDGCRLRDRQMSRVNSRVISGLFGGPVDCFIARNAAVSRGSDKNYVEVGGSAIEFKKISIRWTRGCVE